ncbi:hypothetical protein NMG60_11005410 [Bertholletia excelsa]
MAVLGQNQALALWAMRLGSTLQTALVCTIVACTTFYGPSVLRSQLTFPSFSYMIRDATLGDAVMGLWNALYATTPVLPPSIIGLRLVGPGQFSSKVVAMAASLSAFLVVLLESTNILSKRNAFGQIVIVCVGAVVHGGQAEMVMLPVHVAASTALGVLAFALALLLPYPRLAYFKVRKLCRLYAQNASKKIGLLVKTFSVQDHASSLEATSQTKPFVETAAKLIHSVKLMQDSVSWERPQTRFSKSQLVNPGERLSDMEMASRYCPSFPPSPIIQELSEVLLTVEAQINLKLEHTNFFFLFCVKLLQDDSIVFSSPKPISNTCQKPSLEVSVNSEGQDKFDFKRFSCSCFAGGREATFTLANARAQGAAIGSVYGVLSCFALQRFPELKFILLLPWIIFTSFLRHSRMYGQAGGISATIVALLILVRRDYGLPAEFAIIRLTEVFIGLLCFIVVELLLQPSRAPAKYQLSESLGTLRDCINQIILCPTQKEILLSLHTLREKEEKLRAHVNQLEKFVGQAKLEPNFWFLPFRTASYEKLLGSLSKVMDLLIFVAYIMESLLYGLQIDRRVWREFKEHIDMDVELFKKHVVTPLDYLQKITLIKSLAEFESKHQQKRTCGDLELGTSPNGNVCKILVEEEAKEIENSFLQHLNAVMDRIQRQEIKEKSKIQMVLNLSAMLCCISGIMRETKEIEKGIKELIQWENPSGHINLNDIFCNMNASHPE